MTTTKQDAKSIHAAFVEACAEMQNPKKNASNPAFGGSRYANLEEMLAVSKPILSALGLALIQQPVATEHGVGVHTRIIDSEGAELDFGAFTVPLAKRDPQGAGSAITYCRRYAIAAVFALAQEDDDGNEGSKKPEPEAAPKPKTAKPADSEGWDALVESYKKHGTKNAVMMNLGVDGTDAAAAVRAYNALSAQQKGALTLVAVGAKVGV